jgi:ferrous iron transport protein A
MPDINLTEMRAGQHGQVVAVQGGRGMVMKLEALGIRPGVEITKVSSQIMRGPVIVRAGNTQIAIGFGMAQRIIIELRSTSV